MKQHCTEATEELRQLLLSQGMSSKKVENFINKADQIFFDADGNIKHREIEIGSGFLDQHQTTYSDDYETKTSIIDEGDTISLISKRKKKTKQQKLSRKKNRKK
jgi:hypothetical protein